MGLLLVAVRLLLYLYNHNQATTVRLPVSMCWVELQFLSGDHKRWWSHLALLPALTVGAGESAARGGSVSGAVPYWPDVTLGWAQQWNPKAAGWASPDVMMCDSGGSHLAKIHGEHCPKAVRQVKAGEWPDFIVCVSSEHKNLPLVGREKQWHSSV